MKRALIAAALALAALPALAGQASAQHGGGIGFGIGIGFGCSSWCNKPPCPQYAPPPPCCMPMGYGYGMPQQAPCYGGDPYGMSAAQPAMGAAGPAAAAAAQAAGAAPGGF